MTSFERVVKSLQGKHTDRVAVVPEVFGVTVKTSGYSIYEYITDPRKLAESQLRARELIGHDMLFSFADLSVEAEAIGCELVYKDNAYPVVKGPFINSPDDLDRINLPDPNKTGRMPVVMEASSILREKSGDECIVAACIMGPLSIAGQILGIEGLLYRIMDEPEFIEKVLNFTEEVARVYGLALLEAGAHCHIIFDPMASPMVVPPEVFVRYELPRLRRLFETFKSAGSLFSWLSIAGNTRKILSFYKDASIELATVDYTVPITDAFNLSGIAINGNIKPFSFVTSTAEEIKREATKCMEDAMNRGGFLLGSGCEVPIDSSIENIKALVEAAENVANVTG